MPDPGKMVELKQIIGAMIFVSTESLSVRQLKRFIPATAETHGHEAKAFNDVTEGTVRAARE